MPIDQEEAARRVFPMLDRLEEASWEQWQRPTAEGENSARFSVAELVGTIVFEICEGDVILAVQTVKNWTEERWSRLSPEDLGRGRRLNVNLLTQSVMFLGIGNLCGLNGPGEEYFNEKLAEEGARRGWREPLGLASGSRASDTPQRRLVALSAPPPLPKPLEQMTKEEVREYARPWAEEIVARLKREAADRSPDA